MPVCSERMQKYFDGISGATNTAYAVAQQARSECLDPAADVEIFLASDVAARVEGLVGPRGVAQRIRELLREKKREEVVFEIAREIVEKKFADATLMANGIEPTPEELVEQAIRTGLALYTEGVVSAPIEGISKARIRKNPDGSRYLAIYFAGPIRGAGGTGQAMTLVIGDFCRRLVGIENYRPTGDETDRFIEEVNMYSMRTRAGQYTPTEDEVRHVVTNCPVCIDGEPTEDYEIAVKRNLPNVETNKVRGGVCLVMGEGVCLKAAKILQITKRAKLDWNWLEKLIKVAKKSEARTEIKPVEKFIDEIVGGRPVFSYPMRNGGFRLRYGRSRFMGIQSKGTHPATMTILDDFPAFGTQLKTERPGKGCIITPCRDVDGPVVLLNDGSLLRVESVEEALAVRPHVKEIIFLGDLLVAVGDFIQSNHPLVPSAWCEEWLAAELEAKGATKGEDVSKTRQELKKISFKEARELCATHGVALAPRYTFHWHDLSVAELNTLASWLCEAKLEYEWFDFKKARIPLSSLGVQTPEARAAKRSLEFLCVPHRVENDEVVIERDWALALFETLSLIEGKRADKTKFDAVLAEFREKNDETSAGGRAGAISIAGEKPDKLEKFDKTDKTDERNALELVKLLAPFEVRAKAPLYVGTSMGRPEKSRERQMKPPVNVLYPIAQHGGKTRDIARAVSDLKRDNKTLIDVETAVRACIECGKRARGAKCECGGATREARACSSCGKTFVLDTREAKAQRCGCGGRLEAFEKRGVNVVKEFEDAERRAQFKPRQLKGVIGLISLDKTAEPLEKGILRAKHDLSVFRDGTIRVDATEIPVTHFVPAEIGLTVEKIKALGYERDWKGAPLENAEQTLELLPQDVILSKNAGDYFTRVAAFVDDLLIYFYGLQPFYKAQRREDLIGALGICLAPHTSAGIVTRIIGFNDVHGLQASPYVHCACRRNCLDAKTMLYYENAGGAHASEISSAFEKYAAKFGETRYDDSAAAVDVSKENVFVYGSNKNGEFEKKKVKKLIKRGYAGKMLKIVTKNNQEVVVTPEHVLWVFENGDGNRNGDGELKEKQAKTLCESDLLASLDSIKTNFAEKDAYKSEQIDLVELFSGDAETDCITVRTSKEFCLKTIKALGGYGKTREKLGLSTREMSNFFYRKKYGIPIKVYEKIRSLVSIEASDEKTFGIGFKRNFGETPLRIESDSDFAKLLGYYASEGWTWKSKTKGKESYHVGFAAKNDEVRADMARLIEKTLGVKPYVYKNISATVTNKIIYRLFKEKLGLGSGAYEKNIPEFCFDDEEKLEAFLAGLYQGDGNVAQREIKYCTVSEKLASQLYFALVKLGLRPTFKKEENRRVKTGTVFEKYAAKNKEPPLSTLHYVCLYSSDAVKFNEKVKLISAKGEKQKAFLDRRGRRLIKRFNDARPVAIKKIVEVPIAEAPQFVYDLELDRETGEKIFACGKGMLLSHNCDGDELGIMLFLDATLNFSRHYLPATRGGQMDACLVLTTVLEPKEVDNEVHRMEACSAYPLSFYEATLRFASPGEVTKDIDLIENRLGKPSQYEGMGFTHEARIEGPTRSRYVLFKNMRQKVDDELALMTRIRAVDAANACERLVLNHFFPDLYGNLRKFSRQRFRCTKCNAKYRRPPLSGKCTKPNCGDKLLLTISKGSIEKYLKLSMDLAEKYNLPVYLKQRLMLLEKEIDEMFEDEDKKQFSLANYL